MPRSQVDNCRGNEKRGDASGAALQQFRVFALDHVESADAAGHIDAGHLRDFRGDFQLGHAHGEVRGRQRQLDEPGDFLDLFFLGPVEGIEIADFPGDGAIEGGGVEVGDRADAALSRQEIFPDLIGADSQTADQSDTRYHNPAAHLMHTLLVILRRPANYFLPCLVM